jgi:5-methylcytosine-specific restriction endonuclease McrA
MALRGLISFFEKLHLKDREEPLPEDMGLLARIREGTAPKYLNLESGRLIIASSAAKKTFRNDEYFFCSDNEEQFKRILKALKKGARKSVPPPKHTSKEGIKERRGSEVPSAPKRKTVPKVQRQLLWERDYGNVAKAKCVCCGIQDVSLLTAEAGHIIPHSKGGTYDSDNLRLICRTCNADMGSEHMDEFMKRHNYPLKEVAFL